MSVLHRSAVEPSTLLERYRDGRLEELRRVDGAPAPTADVVLEHAGTLRWPIPVPSDEHADPVALHSLRVVGGDGIVRPFPPLDLVAEPRFDLPSFPRADLRIQFVLAGGPLGPVDLVLEFVAGQLIRCDTGRDEHDVLVHLRFTDVLRLRLGAITTADAVLRGQVTGRFSQLNLLSGLIDADEFRAGLTSYAADDAALLLWCNVQRLPSVLAARPAA